MDLELISMVGHLFLKLGGGEGAYTEVCYRTRVSPEKCVDRNQINSAKEMLQKSDWAKIMTVRRESAKQKLINESPAMEEIGEVTLSMYGGGCSWGSLGSTVTTIASMLTEVNLKDEVLEEAARTRKEGEEAGGIGEKASTDDILAVFEDVLLKEKMHQWWLKDDYSDASQPLLVGIHLKDTPYPQLCLEYVPLWPCSSRRPTSIPQSELRHRILNLKGKLSTETASLTYLGRSLAERYSFLLKEENKWVQTLSKLQRLMKETAEAAKINAASRPAVTSIPTTTGLEVEEAESAPKKGDLGLLYREGESALKDVDLQDADDLTVKEYKAKMDNGFNKNKLRPGDEGYQYDVRVDVKPTEKSEWDDSDED